MKAAKRITMLLLAALSAGCSSGEPPPADQFVATWQATKIVYTSNTGLGSTDIVTSGGSATLVLGSDGRFQFTLTQPNASTGTLKGTYVVSSIDLISLTRDDGINFAWGYSLSGNVLQVSCGVAAGTGSDNCAMVLGPGGGVGFDFNGDGQLESARWSITFQR